MTAQGEDILAWLEKAITAREETARAAEAVDPSPWTAGRDQDASVAHIAANDPASVLRRYAADRRIISELRDLSMLSEAPGQSMGIVERMALRGIRAALLNLAEGYGWTEGER